MNWILRYAALGLLILVSGFSKVRAELVIKVNPDLYQKKTEAQEIGSAYNEQQKQRRQCLGIRPPQESTKGFLSMFDQIPDYDAPQRVEVLMVFCNAKNGESPCDEFSAETLGHIFKTFLVGDTGKLDQAKASLNVKLNWGNFPLYCLENYVMPNLAPVSQKYVMQKYIEAQQQKEAAAPKALPVFAQNKIQLDPDFIPGLDAGVMPQGAP
jgi:hypothetical protein